MDGQHLCEKEDWCMHIQIIGIGFFFFFLPWGQWHLPIQFCNIFFGLFLHMGPNLTWLQKLVFDITTHYMGEPGKHLPSVMHNKKTSQLITTHYIQKKDITTHYKTLLIGSHMSHFLSKKKMSFALFDLIETFQILSHLSPYALIFNQNMVLHS